MDRTEIESRLRDLASKVEALQGRTASAGVDEAAVLRTQIAVLAEDKRRLEERLVAAVRDEANKAQG